MSNPDILSNPSKPGNLIRLWFFGLDLVGRRQPPHPLKPGSRRGPSSPRSPRSSGARAAATGILEAAIPGRTRTSDPSLIRLRVTPNNLAATVFSNDVTNAPATPNNAGVLESVAAGTARATVTAVNLGPTEPTIRGLAQPTPANREVRLSCIYLTGRSLRAPPPEYNFR